MQCTRINQISQSGLLNPAQPLKVGSFNNIVDKLAGYANKPINRVVENLFLVQHISGLVFDVINLIKKIRVTYEIEEDIRYSLVTSHKI